MCQWNHLGALGLAGCGVGLRSVEVRWSGVHGCSIFWAWPGEEWGRARGSEKACVTTGLGLVWIPSSGDINSVVVCYRPLNIFKLLYFEGICKLSPSTSECVCVFFLTYFLLWVVQKRVRETQYGQNPVGKCPHCPSLFLLSIPGHFN